MSFSMMISSIVTADTAAVSTLRVTPFKPSTLASVPCSSSASRNLAIDSDISLTTNDTMSNWLLFARDLDTLDRAPARYPVSSILVNFPLVLVRDLNSSA